MENFNQIRYTIAQIIALVATAIGIFVALIIFEVIHVGFMDGALGDIIGLTWIVLVVAAYICGGLLTALKMVWSIAVWGWRVVPFPYDILTFVFSAAFAAIVMIFLPIIPVRKAYKENV